MKNIFCKRGNEEMKIFTANRETGMLIDEFKTVEEALKEIKRYETIDKKEGVYESDFYDVVNEDRISLL